MGENQDAVRGILDQLVQRAKDDPEFQRRLDANPEQVIVEAGLSRHQADSLIADWEHEKPASEGEVGGYMRCQISCTRHPATQWPCGPLSAYA